MAPIVSPLIGSTAGGALAGKGRQGWWEDAGFEPRVLVVPRLPGADRVTCRDQNDLVSGRELNTTRERTPVEDRPACPRSLSMLSRVGVCSQAARPSIVSHPRWRRARS